ncbi:Wzz/FepE/Etk N-terminal domain-containing protein [Rhodanobacter sp. MP7CTX1]|jgi:LPS O-antigen subunit length determinant protein (WzzB/FepE family)|uniref:Wzz/FepE/Etk N-terminal domain-containing protein n=1 Tax=Rhodanobacter sp. MP7CTX1 TaxID=2723084 RepID=UPI001607615D|nr:Wzz/FepE/Etk N-terminal domain-containing protein [Rhodanobacter sp. MP7CTX1]MBB6186038.1 LPS O-antigen subunit length determinant protein (WzzB/FepE family) [Rhodanobacter sp. MP7CTX1]
MEQDEIYLIDLWRTLFREWKWFAAVLIVTLACTYAFTHLVKRQWEATAWILIGQVGQVPSGQDQKTEPLQRVLERLQLVPFQNDVLKGIGLSPDSPEAQLYRGSLKLDPLPYAGPLIRLSVRAHSPQQARQFATATVVELHAVHQHFDEVPLKLARARLDEIQADLQSALADRSRLLQILAPENKGDAASKSLASVSLASKDEEIRKLQEARSDLIDRLSPTYTYETSLPWPVYVPDRQAFPNPALMWGIGLLLGIVLGLFAATTRSVARRQA